MRKRLYFLLPDLGEASKTVDELLLARIDEKHIHVMAKQGVDLGDLPEASIFQTSDIVHGVETGIVIGGITGLVASIIAITALQVGSVMGLIVLGCTLFGAGFGVWTSAMIGSSTKNSRLKEFELSMEEGKILLIADVPIDKVDDINHKMQAHKETIMGGSDPSIPVFP
ncbi:MAG: DUF1269 domain-containing protein [Gammaproteobacteria bacterium]|nr:DUF1269 domain-containing protein [Gammaproteobacteria bacterium]